MAIFNGGSVVGLKTNIKSILIGTTASFSLLGFYFTILALTESISHAVESFLELKYQMSALVLGFGSRPWLTIQATYINLLAGTGLQQEAIIAGEHLPFPTLTGRDKIL
jgi:hypothetical protein